MPCIAILGLRGYRAGGPFRERPTSSARPQPDPRPAVAADGGGSKLAPLSLAVPAHVPLVVVREAEAMLRTALTAPLPVPRLGTPAPVAGQPPVILVHGLMGHRGQLVPLGRALLAAGAPEVELVGYPAVRPRFEDVVDRIAAAAEPLARRHGRVDLVGHSLGALAGHAWIKEFGGAPHVGRFVSLGGPHAGTAWHRALPGALGRLFDPQGAWVRRLADGEEPVPTTVIRARFDHQVLPPVRAAIPGAREVVLQGHGHTGLLFASAVHEAVIAALRRGPEGDGPR
ncbi:MAG: hypothetical protein H6732_09280 [Alphaproteobacteria bacterium]|nr:hypothetical protein [Alphaproteobacteria bacterium]